MTKSHEEFINYINNLTPEEMLADLTDAGFKIAPKKNYSFNHYNILNKQHLLKHLDVSYDMDEGLENIIFPKKENETQEFHTKKTLVTC